MRKSHRDILQAMNPSELRDLDLVRCIDCSRIVDKTKLGFHKSRCPGSNGLDEPQEMPGKRSKRSHSGKWAPGIEEPRIDEGLSDEIVQDVDEQFDDADERIDVSEQLERKDPVSAEEKLEEDEKVEIVEDAEDPEIDWANQAMKLIAENGPSLAYIPRSAQPFVAAKFKQVLTQLTDQLRGGNNEEAKRSAFRLFSLPSKLLPRRVAPQNRKKQHVRLLESWEELLHIDLDEAHSSQEQQSQIHRQI